MVEAVKKISAVRPVEAWANLSAQVRRTRLSARQRQGRQQRTPTQETILRQTTRLHLDEKQISLSDGYTRLEARHRRLEMVQVQEQITRRYGPTGEFRQLVDASRPVVREPSFSGAVVVPRPEVLALPMPTPQAMTNAAVSAAAYERTGLTPAPLPGGQVNRLA
ncbi:MAG: hypothetical protein KJ621_16100 [Proteobacteria bacterium]|nr:hypothetical protein [Pseudomonadota bacterium]MBU1740123.1 hypothetical protein [Pseudomonadota bacterium]